MNTMSTLLNGIRFAWGEQRALGYTNPSGEKRVRKGMAVIVSQGCL